MCSKPHWEPAIVEHNSWHFLQSCWTSGCHMLPGRSTISPILSCYLSLADSLCPQITKPQIIFGRKETQNSNHATFTHSCDHILDAFKLQWFSCPAESVLFMNEKWADKVNNWLLMPSKHFPSQCFFTFSVEGLQNVHLFFCLSVHLHVCLKQTP